MGDARTLALAPKAKAGRVPVVQRRCRPAERSPALIGRLQPALRVGAANDPLELEAERTSERIVSMPAPAEPAPSPRDPQGEPEARRAIDQESQPNTELFDSAPAIPADHQDPEVPKTEDVDTAGLHQDEFGEIEEGEPTPPPAASLQASADGPGVGAEGGKAPADVANRVAQCGSGRALPDSVRSFMEPRFGVSFRDVRIHDEPEDRRIAERIGARAFTHRHHIWLGSGEQVDDRRLLAHELTHVVQQTRREAPDGDAARDVGDAQRAPEPQIRRGYLRNKAEKYAREIPGYFTIEVILGKSPITGEEVPRNAENLVGAFLSLLPGGHALFEKLQESHALTDAFEWISNRLSELNITWSRIKGLISDFIDAMPTLHPIRVGKRIFGPLISDIITFVTDIAKKVLEFIIHGALKLAGPWGEKVWGVIVQAGEAISLIIEDPLGFAKNLFESLVGGFKKFGSNIWKHIKAGLMAWLFGPLKDLQIELPEKLDFKGILSVVLQIVGLTYANFRRILVSKLGTGGERKVAFLEKSVEVVKILLKEGFVGIWQRVIESIDNFKTTIIDGIKDYVITSLVKGALTWIAGLANPIGGIVKVALAIYNMIKTFLERLEQIIEMITPIFASITAIAKGQISQAIDFVENALAKTIPVFLSFIAAVIPIPDVTESIRRVINKIQTAVNNAITKLADFLVKKAKKLFSRILGKVNRKRELAKHGFVVGKEPHQLIPEKAGNSFVLKIASGDGKLANQAQTEVKAERKKAGDLGDDSKCSAAFGDAFQVEVDQAEAKLKQVKPEQEKDPTKRQADAAEKETTDAGDKLSKLGPCLAENPFFEDDPKDGAIIRAREPRIPQIEGKAGLYKDRGAETRKTIQEVAGKASLGERGSLKLSNYYENDHIPEKSLGADVQEYIQGDLQAEISKGERAGRPIPVPNLGEIDTRALGEKGEQLPTITVYRPLHRQKTAKTKRNHKKIIADAKAKSTPLQKIAALRAGVQKEMEVELALTVEEYNSDKAATKEIRANVQSGLDDLGRMNKVLFGFEPGKAPALKPGGKEGAEGSDLPMEPEPGSDTPNFFKLEGARTDYGAKPKGVGNYLEYDHVIEATLAEKAKELTLDDPAFSGELEEQIKARSAEKGAEEAKGGDKGRAVELITERAKGRRRSLQGAACTGTIASYNRERAGTIALYRPVHREVTGKLPGVRAGIVGAKELTEARTKLVDYLVSDPPDMALRKAAISEIQLAVHKRFESAIDEHIGFIRAQYGIEQREFLALNKSKEAAGKMAEIVGRVEATLRTLRGESLDLLK